MYKTEENLLVTVNVTKKQKNAALSCHSFLVIFFENVQLCVRHRNFIGVFPKRGTVIFPRFNLVGSRRLYLLCTISYRRDHSY